jgi:hypothetical protein
MVQQELLVKAMVVVMEIMTDIEQVLAAAVLVVLVAMLVTIQVVLEEQEHLHTHLGEQQQELVTM